jgi:hypothetical protein
MFVWKSYIKSVYMALLINILHARLLLRLEMMIVTN